MNLSCLKILAHSTTISSLTKRSLSVRWRHARCTLAFMNRWFLGFSCASLLLMGCSAHRTPLYTETGIASWYGWGYAGRRTAGGERFWPWKNVAAHRTLPLGTRVRVTNLNNGRVVWVRIEDRGPVTEERILDVSRSVAKELKFKRQGLASVLLEVYDWP